MVETGHTLLSSLFRKRRQVPHASIAPFFSLNAPIIPCTSNLLLLSSPHSTPFPSKKTLTECPLSSASTPKRKAFHVVSGSLEFSTIPSFTFPHPALLRVVNYFHYVSFSLQRVFPCYFWEKL